MQYIELQESEAQAVRKMALQVFEYRQDEYWLPIEYERRSDELAHIQYLFVMESYIEPYMQRIFDLVINNDEGMYLCLAYWCKSKCYVVNDPHIASIDKLCTEFALFTKDFSSIIYKSHEGTISFAGKCLNGIKRILEPVRDKWYVYKGG